MFPSKFVKFTLSNVPCINKERFPKPQSQNLSVGRLDLVFSFQSIQSFLSKLSIHL